MSLLVFAKKGTKERVLMSITFSLEQVLIAEEGVLSELNKESNEWELISILDNGFSLKLKSEDIYIEKSKQ